MARGFIPLADQMRFMWQELQGPEAGTLQAFNQRAAQGNIPGSAADYATLFDQTYERSGGSRDAEARAYASDVFGAVGTDAFENLPPNAKFAYSFLTHKGLTPEQAAGVTGRLMVESYARVDPNARNTIGGGSGTYGIAQWRGPRLEALADYAGVSMDDIRNLPISTPEGNYYSTKGLGQTQGAGPVGLLDTQQPQQPQQSGFWGNFAGGVLADPDRRARLAMALEGMMLNPNQGVVQAAQAGIEQRRTQGQINKTMEWLAQQPGGEAYTQLAAAGDPVGALRAYTSDISAANDPSVQSVQSLPDGGAVYYMKDGGIIVRDVTGQQLTGEAAQDYVRQAQEYGADLQREIYGARQSGTMGVQAEMGAVVSGASEAGKISVQAGADAWTGYGKLQTSLANIDEAIRAIDAGGETGAIAKYLPNVTEASASLRNAMDRMGLDIVSATTFGALSEGELRLAMQTAAPQDLGPAELRSWLVRRREAQAKAAEMLGDAALFLSTPGNTLDMWIARNRGGPTDAAPAPSQAAPNTADPLGWR